MSTILKISDRLGLDDVDYKHQRNSRMLNKIFDDGLKELEEQQSKCHHDYPAPYVERHWDHWTVFLIVRCKKCRNIKNIRKLSEKELEGKHIGPHDSPNDYNFEF